MQLKEGEHPMSVEDNKAAVQRMGEEAFNQGNLDVLDELVAQDVVDHDPAPGQASGREGIKQFVSTLRTAFPDGAKCPFAPAAYLRSRHLDTPSHKIRSRFPRRLLTGSFMNRGPRPAKAP